MNDIGMSTSMIENTANKKRKPNTWRVTFDIPDVNKTMHIDYEAKSFIDAQNLFISEKVVVVRSQLIDAPNIQLRQFLLTVKIGDNIEVDVTTEAPDSYAALSKLHSEEIRVVDVKLLNTKVKSKVETDKKVFRPKKMEERLKERK